MLAEATKPETALEKSLAPWVTEPENQDEIKVWWAPRPGPTLPGTIALSLSCGSVTENRDIFVEFKIEDQVHFGMVESLGQLQLDMG